MTLTARSPRSGPGTLTAPAPAKINLTLNVLGSRPDGYHEIRSLVIGVDFADQITVTSAAPDVRTLTLDTPVPPQAGRSLPRTGLAQRDPACQGLTCDDPALPVDERNLIQQAATLLARQAGVRAGWRIGLAKRIPIGGGLGGGSSDAATTLRLLNELWACGCSSAELAALGAQLGSDVPLFFALPAAVIEGRGERVRPVKLAWSGWITLILGGWPVATRDAYQAWCAGAGAAPDPHAAEAAIVHARAADQISPWLVNDLESAVMRICPPMSSLQRSASALTSSSVRMSGAGSTLFALFDTQEQAQALADTVRARLGVPAAHVVRTLDHQTP